MPAFARYFEFAESQGLLSVIRRENRSNHAHTRQGNNNGSAGPDACNSPRWNDEDARLFRINWEWPFNEEKASQLSGHFQLLRRAVRELNQTIRNKRETHINMTPEGVAMAYKYAQTYHHFMNTTYRWPSIILPKDLLRSARKFSRLN